MYFTWLSSYLYLYLSASQQRYTNGSICFVSSVFRVKFNGEVNRRPTSVLSAASSAIGSILYSRGVLRLSIIRLFILALYSAYIAVACIA